MNRLRLWCGRFFNHLFYLVFLFGCQQSNTNTQEDNNLHVHPRLLFTEADIPALKSKSKTPEGIAIISQLEKRLAEPVDALFVGAYAAGYAFLHLLTDNPEYAKLSQQFAEMTINDDVLFQSGDGDTKDPSGIPLWNSNYKEIYRSQNIIGLALAYDLSFHVWDETFRMKIVRELEEKTSLLIDGGGHGYNDKPWSNWQGITKGSGLFAALAISGDSGLSDAFDGYLQKAEEGLKAHLDHLGERGWTPEGFNYLRLALCTGIFPALQAYAHTMQKPLIDANMVDWFLPFFTMNGLVIKDTLYQPMHGTGNFVWNTDRWRSGDWVMGMGTVPAKFLPAILWTFDPVFGLSGDQTFNIFKPYDAIFAMVNYPLDQQPANPAEVLDRVWVDEKAGYYVFRNGWQDENDIVVSIHANKLAKPASHSFRDAGSFRISGLGTHWAIRPVHHEAKVITDFENRVVIENATNWLGAETTHFQKKSDGSGSISLKMDSSYFGGSRLKDKVDLGIKANRSISVDFSGKSGAEALLAIVDRFEGGGDKIWQMFTHEDAVEIVNNQFTISASNGATLRASFVYPPNVELNFDATHKLIKASSSDHFFVIMTLQKGAIPAIDTDFNIWENGAKVGDLEIKFDKDNISIK